MTSMTNGVELNLNLQEIPRWRGKNMPAVFLLCIAFALLLTGCSVPDHGKVFFSYTRWDKGCDDLANCSKLTDERYASGYYQAIGAEDAAGNPNFNFEQWKQLYGYQNATVVRAVYGNKLDLQFGRDMNCWQPQGTEQVVCYVTNYGPAPFVNGKENPAWPNLARGVFDAAAGDIHNTFGTVAMVYDPNGLGPFKFERLGFYAFGKPDADGNSPLIRSVALDGEGPKTVPAICQNCHSGGDHGGLYHGDSFLPFDVQSFSFDSTVYDGDGNPSSADVDLDSQQEAFRQLNALVKKAPRAPAIDNLINGWYSGNVNTAGATVPDDTYIPAGWDIDKTSRNLYRHVYRKYCRMCHSAQRYNDDYKDNLAFESFSDFQQKADEIGRHVCGFHSMPNSEVPYGAYPPQATYARFAGFWTDQVAQSDLRDFLQANGSGGCN